MAVEEIFLSFQRLLYFVCSSQIVSINFNISNLFHRVYHGSSVSVVTRLWAGELGFTCWQGLGYFLLATASRLAQGPIQLPIQWMLGCSFPGG